MHGLRTRLATLGAAAFFALALAACSAGAASPTPTLAPSPTPRPTPTPVAVSVSSPAEAAAIVLASDPRFAGAIELTPDIIGASRWWKAEALPGGGYRVEVTIGWGDCPAGCIDRHVWTFDVDPTGGLTLVSETGDPVPSDPPA